MNLMRYWSSTVQQMSHGVSSLLIRHQQHWCSMFDCLGYLDGSVWFSKLMMILSKQLEHRTYWTARTLRTVQTSNLLENEIQKKPKNSTVQLNKINSINCLNQIRDTLTICFRPNWPYNKLFGEIQSQKSPILDQSRNKLNPGIFWIFNPTE